MTDFLTRLAERTLGRAPRVQPLVASRYASVSAAPTLPESLGEDAAVASVRSADPTQAPMPRSRDIERPTSRPVLPHAVSESRATSGVTEGVSHPFVPHENMSRPAAPAPIESRATSEKATFDKALPEKALSETHETSRTSRMIAKPDPPPTETTTHAATLHVKDALPLADSPWDHQSLQGLASSRESREKHYEEFPAQEPRAGSPRLSAAPQVQVVARPGERGELGLPPVDRVARRAEDVRLLPVAINGRSEPDSSASASVPPVIRVTIGRIEVRAIPPPTPAAERPVPPRANPVLSLDAYLKQQNEGRR